MPAPPWRGCDGASGSAPGSPARARGRIQQGLARGQVSLDALFPGITHMHLLRWPLLLLSLLAVCSVQAQDLATTCHASSSYDVNLKPGSLLFERIGRAACRERGCQYG